MISQKGKEHTDGMSGLRTGTNQHGFQRRWEVTDRKDTWSDEFLTAVGAYFGAM